MKNLVPQISDQSRNTTDKLERNKSLSLENTMSYGTFSTQENGIIAFAVMQATDGEEECNIPRANRKLTLLSTLAKELTIKKGEAAQATIQSFLEAGYSDSSLNELMAKVAIRSASNYLFGNIFNRPPHKAL